MEIGTVILIITTSLTLAVSALDTCMNGYTGWKNRTFHSSCCGLDMDYTSEAESNMEAKK